jgi:hypothetical protein
MSWPDVLVKGGDYEGEMVVGAEQVQSRGGPVKTVPIVDLSSTPQADCQDRRQLEGFPGRQVPRRIQYLDVVFDPMPAG